MYGLDRQAAVTEIGVGILEKSDYVCALCPKMPLVPTMDRAVWRNTLLEATSAGVSMSEYHDGFRQLAACQGSGLWGNYVYSPQISTVKNVYGEKRYNSFYISIWTLILSCPSFSRTIRTLSSAAVSSWRPRRQLSRTRRMSTMKSNRTWVRTMKQFSAARILASRLSSARRI